MIGILLVNLGTPSALSKSAVRAYLKEFLWDSRVVELPRVLWWLILHGIVLNTRPAQSVKKYAAVWMPEGSPLRVYTQRQAALLRGTLGEAGYTDVLVEYAMRYGQPSISDGLEKLKTQGCRRIIIIPLYPQYAASTTGSVWDVVAQWVQRTRNVPDLRLVRDFHQHAAYVEALVASVRTHWQKQGRAGLLLMSFHGIPQRSVQQGDPYYAECQQTATLLAQALGLTQNQYCVTFQSRFGYAEWLQPYTLATLEDLPKQGVKTVDVICPGFVSDCLETLEEIAMEGKAAFLQRGGTAFRMIPCLNDSPLWIDALAKIVIAQF